jgi:hypothetical protein
MTPIVTARLDIMGFLVNDNKWLQGCAFMKLNSLWPGDCTFYIFEERVLSSIN